MDRRDFLKTLVAASLASPLLTESKSFSLESTLYLISDSPELFLPALLKELTPRCGLNDKLFSLAPSFPAAKKFSRALQQSGWTLSSAASSSTISFSYRILDRPAFPSFTLIRGGKIQDIRRLNLFGLWKKMNSGLAPSSFLTIASFSTPAQLLRQGQRITIYASGKRVASYALDKDRAESIRTERGRLVISIESGQARVISSPCPHQICVATPPLLYAGERIICAPSHFLMEVEGPSLVDTVTG